MSRTRRAQAAPTGHEAFLPLPENRFAWTALQRLAKSARRTPHPLVYIYGPSGCGKSHLVRTFLRDERRRDGTQRIAHLTAADFAAELAEASDSGRIDDFQRQYRSSDIFACEDVQSLDRRAESQQQLLSTIDELLSTGKRVVITSTKAPGELAGLPFRLINRFQGGVSAVMQRPGEKSRALLIAHFAGLHQIPMTDGAVEQLSRELAVSPRELQSAVSQLEIAARQQKRPIDREFVEWYLKLEVKPPRATLPAVAKAVARHFGLRLADLKSSKRSQGLLVPRQVAMYLARERTDASLRNIAAYFGRDNHSCVAHAWTRVNELLATEPSMRQHIHQVDEVLKSQKPTLPNL